MTELADQTSCKNAHPDTTAPRCWICGSVADSGEHKAKRSDLKGVFENVSQSHPLFVNDANNRNCRIGSTNADLVKWERMLCAACNSTRTQPHDSAWATMSKALRSWTPALVSGSIVRANRVFPVGTTRAMVDVHLYFVKALGCLVKAAGSVNIDLSSFGRAIMETRAHSGVYLAFGIAPRISRGPIVNASDLSVLKEAADGSVALLTWFYNVNGMCALVAYAPDLVGSVWARKERLWHPRDGSNRFEMLDFDNKAEVSPREQFSSKMQA